MVPTLFRNFDINLKTLNVGFSPISTLKSNHTNSRMEDLKSDAEI